MWQEEGQVWQEEGQVWQEEGQVWQEGLHLSNKFLDRFICKSQQPS